MTGTLLAAHPVARVVFRERPRHNLALVPTSVVPSACHASSTESSVTNLRKVRTSETFESPIKIAHSKKTMKKKILKINGKKILQILRCRLERGTVPERTHRRSRSSVGYRSNVQIRRWSRASPQSNGRWKCLDAESRRQGRSLKTQSESTCSLKFNLQLSLPPLCKVSKGSREALELTRQQLRVHASYHALSTTLHKLIDKQIVLFVTFF